MTAFDHAAARRTEGGPATSSRNASLVSFVRAPVARAFLRAAPQSESQSDLSAAVAPDVSETAVRLRRADAAGLAEMSHGLRTPLNVVMGFAQLLECELHGPLGHPRYAEYATAIRTESSRLLTVVADILAFAEAAAEARGDPRPLGARRKMATIIVE